MAEVEITHDEVRGIDINQVASMQLKDGTVVVVNSEATAEAGNCQGSGEFFLEETVQDGYAQEGQEENAYQENQLRARPMVGMPYGRPAVVPVRPAVRPAVVPVRPAVRPAVVPVRPAVVPVPGRFPKPVPRGPVARPGMPVGGVVFRARPGMPVHMAPQRMVPVRPGVPVRPAVQPIRPVPGTMMPKPVPVRPGVPVASKPMGVPARPLVNQMITAPRVFRARPNVNDEDDFQQEYCDEEDYCECYEETGEVDQLRARPFVAPMTYGPKVVGHPVHHPPHHQPMVAPRVVPLPAKRGPTVMRPGYNTFQPGVFRARPRMGVARPGVGPMFTPVAPGYGVGRVVRPIPPPPRPYGFGMGPVFRSRRETTYTYEQEPEQEQDYLQQYTEQCVDEEVCDGNNSCVCQ